MDSAPGLLGRTRRVRASIGQGVFSQLPKQFDALRNGFRATVDRSAGNNQAGAGTHDLLNGVLIDAAIDFDINVDTTLVDNPAHLSDLRLDLWNVRLSAVARVNCHQQRSSDVIQERQDGIDRCFGFDGDSCLCPRLTYRGNCSGQIRAGLCVNNDDVAACPRNIFHLSRGFGHHHVDDEGQAPGIRLNRLNHLRAKRDGRNKVAVHHVDVYVVCAAPGRRLYLFAKSCEIGGKDGRANLDVIAASHVWRLGFFRVQTRACGSDGITHAVRRSAANYIAFGDRGLNSNIQYISFKVLRCTLVIVEFQVA